MDVIKREGDFTHTSRRKGEVRVVAPARGFSLSWITSEMVQLAEKRLEAFGFEVTYGDYVHDNDLFDSALPNKRVQDIHSAFLDDNVQLILALVGGYGSNQLLNKLDYDLISEKSKPFCGSSDVTAIVNAIFARTENTTYLGPMFYHFGEVMNFDYTLHHFTKCIFGETSYQVAASEFWSNDRWAIDQFSRNFKQNHGYWIISEGEAKGVAVGGNVTTLNLLQGTSYFPLVGESILLLEATRQLTPQAFERNLQALVLQEQFARVRAIIIGRFETRSMMTRDLLETIIRSKQELKGLPVVANIDIGHTSPIGTFPIGGTISLVAREDEVRIEVLEH